MVKHFQGGRVVLVLVQFFSDAAAGGKVKDDVDVFLPIVDVL